MAELHVHGGRAVVAAVEAALLSHRGLRRATAGEFTRRAFANGRIDLAEAEGLADLLSAETELQRRSAMILAGGAFSRQIEQWRDMLLNLSALIEASLDFSDEDDVAPVPEQFGIGASALHTQLLEWLSRPRASVIKEGYRVVLAGPPNVGKSTLFNALIESDAAITSAIAGTTRDVLSRTVGLGGVPFQFFDTAGLHDRSVDEIEAIGIERAEAMLADADLVLWLGEEGEGPAGAWEIDSRCDLPGTARKSQPRHVVSALTGEGLVALRTDLIDCARDAMPRPNDAALNERQAQQLEKAADAIADATLQRDPLLMAEYLRQARLAFDSLLGRAATEDMLDTLFGRFCIGK